MRMSTDDRARDVAGPPLCPDGCMLGEDCADALGMECTSPLDAPLDARFPDHVAALIR